MPSVSSYWSSNTSTCILARGIHCWILNISQVIDYCVCLAERAIGNNIDSPVYFHMQLSHWTEIASHMIRCQPSLPMTELSRSQTYLMLANLYKSLQNCWKHKTKSIAFAATLIQGRWDCWLDSMIGRKLNSVKEMEVSSHSILSPHILCQYNCDDSQIGACIAWIYFLFRFFSRTHTFLPYNHHVQRQIQRRR